MLGQHRHEAFFPSCRARVILFPLSSALLNTHCLFPPPLFFLTSGSTEITEVFVELQVIFSTQQLSSANLCESPFLTRFIADAGALHLGYNEAYGSRADGDHCGWEDIDAVCTQARSARYKPGLKAASCSSLHGKAVDTFETFPHPSVTARHMQKGRMFLRLLTR